MSEHDGRSVTGTSLYLWELKGRVRKWWLHVDQDRMFAAMPGVSVRFLDVQQTATSLSLCLCFFLSPLGCISFDRRNARSDREVTGSVVDMCSALVWFAIHGSGFRLLIGDHRNTSAYEKETK